MIRSYKSRVAVFLQEKSVDVLSGAIEREPRRIFYFLVYLLHRFPIDVDFTGSSGGKKLSVKSKTPSHTTSTGPKVC